uniref:Uncharacterized protein n=1 Tax=Caenorhabditis japonica TaxID=281687 RepID=A0A8R1HZR7_CAEJA
MTAPSTVEKDYDKIDEKLGDDHVRKIVESLMNMEENGEEACRNLMDLHKQCCEVFSKHPIQQTMSQKWNKERSKQKTLAKS